MAPMGSSFHERDGIRLNAGVIPFPGDSSILMHKLASQLERTMGVGLRCSIDDRGYHLCVDEFAKVCLTRGAKEFYFTLRLQSGEETLFSTDDLSMMQEFVGQYLMARLECMDRDSRQ